MSGRVGWGTPGGGSPSVGAEARGNMATLDHWREAIGLVYDMDARAATGVAAESIVARTAREASWRP